MTAPDSVTEPTHRQAWDLLETGQAHSAVAKTVGVTRSTVSRWVSKWRIEFDAPDLFLTEATASRAKQTQAARAERDRRWVEARVTVEQAAAEFALDAIGLARSAIAHIDPKTLTASDLRQLMVAFGITVDKLQDVVGAEQRPGRTFKDISEVDKAFKKMMDDARAVAGAT